MEGVRAAFFFFSDRVFRVDLIQWGRDVANIAAVRSWPHVLRGAGIKDRVKVCEWEVRGDQLLGNRENTGCVSGEWTSVLCLHLHDVCRPVTVGLSFASLQCGDRKPQKSLWFGYFMATTMKKFTKMPEISPAMGGAESLRSQKGCAMARS